MRCADAACLRRAKLRPTAAGRRPTIRSLRTASISEFRISGAQQGRRRAAEARQASDPSIALRRRDSALRYGRAQLHGPRARGARKRSCRKSALPNSDYGFLAGAMVTGVDLLCESLYAEACAFGLFSLRLLRLFVASELTFGHCNLPTTNQFSRPQTRSCHSISRSTSECSVNGAECVVCHCRRSNPPRVSNANSAGSPSSKASINLHEVQGIGGDTLSLRTTGRARLELDSRPPRLARRTETNSSTPPVSYPRPAGARREPNRIE